MTLHSPAKKIGELLTEEFQKNPKFYFFSPDETTSNKFDQIYETEKRAWNMPTRTWDLPESSDGRIVEMLSENVLFSVMMGHIMNGEPAMMGSYEAFFPIITSQLLQQMKFIKQSNETKWRRSLPAVNLLSTSTCWRQDHNGYTHQSPALISTLLSVPSNLVNCIFPVDDKAAEIAYKYMIDSTNVVNLTTFNKIEEPRYTNDELANKLMKEGAAIYEPASNANPDIVLAAAGDIMMHEIVEAAKIAKDDMPKIGLRLVYINTLSYRAIGTTEHKMSSDKFNKIFTADKPIIANFHGYPATLEDILCCYAEKKRLAVHGYMEEGSTTTPHEMLRRNGTSRYNILCSIAELQNRKDLLEKYRKILDDNHAYAVEHGEDMIK